MEEINALVSESKLKADEDLDTTNKNLLELYKNAFPHDATPEMIGEEWKRLGFQVCLYIILKIELFLWNHK